MSIGIAIICDSGKSVVMAADRAVTVTPGDIWFTLERNHAKIRRISPTCMCVFSSDDTQESKDILDRLVKDAKTPESSIAELADKLFGECMRARREGIALELERRCLTFESYNDSLLREGEPSKVADEISRLGLKGIFLLAGADATGAHVYQISDAAKSNHDDLGFMTIGSGQILAFPSIGQRSLQGPISLEDGILAAYEAKCMAEPAAGIRPGTDIAFVRSGGQVAYLLPDAIDALSAIYRDRLRLRESDRDKIRLMIESAGAKRHL